MFWEEVGGPTPFHLGRRGEPPEFPMFFFAKAQIKSEEEHE